MKVPLGSTPAARPSLKAEMDRKRELSLVAEETSDGEEALWYPHSLSAFAARSSGYSEVMLVQVRTLLNIANQDPAVKNRYRIFRDIMRSADQEDGDDNRSVFPESAPVSPKFANFRKDS
jgi:hypothetical protein